MKDSIINIENKIRSQLDHVFSLNNTEGLKTEINDLIFEWYLKGFDAAVEYIKESRDK